MTYWTTVQRVAMALIFGVILVGVVLLFVPKINELRALHEERQTRQKENAQIEVGADNLRNNCERFQKDPAFVERVARDIGMVKPDEIKVIVTDPTGNTAKQREATNAPPRRR